MNKTIIRVFGFMVLISPWMYISSVYKDVFSVLAGLVILSATVSLKKKKRVLDESGDKDNSLD